jgi:molybdate transport system permease protein
MTTPGDQPEKEPETADKAHQDWKEINPGTVVLSDRAFKASMVVLFATYTALLVLLVVGDLAYVFKGTGSANSWLDNPIVTAFQQAEIRNSIVLSLVSCSLSAFLSLGVAIPIGYLLAKTDFFGKNLLDAILDIPIVLPPLVIGISLLILFQFPPFSIPLDTILPGDWGGKSLNSYVVYQVPAVVLAQFTVAAAFAVRTMKSTFEQIDDRREQVALTLGCTRLQAFNRVVLPEAKTGIVTAWTLAWARSLGEFGPLLIFAGATRNKTEVLSTTVFLELSIGNLEAAVAVSVIMVFAAVIVLIIARVWGRRGLLL